jgi:SPP1 family holin
MEKTDIGTITRTILIVIALINQGLLIAGKNPLPFEDDQIAQVISFGFTAVTALIAWWKNNNFSQEAKEAQHYLDALKSVKSKE